MTKKIKSNLSQNEHGNQFSPVVIDGNGIVIRNASDERLPDGTEVPAGSQTLMLVSDGQNSLFNASFIRTGVLDASLLRSGMIQVSPSWNNKFLGNVKDNYNLLQIYSGGALKATAVSTTANHVTLTLGSGHGFNVNDYIRVSGIIFSQDGSTGDRGMNTAKFGELNYGQVTSTATSTVTYSLTGVGSGKTLGANSTAYASKAVVVNQIIRIYTDDDDQNALETAKCTVTTGTAHGLASGDYVEIAGTSQEFNGIWRVDSAPSTTTFVFYQKYADDEDWYNDFTVTMPTYGTPVALKLSKAASISTTGGIVATGAELNPGGPRQSALLLQGAATEGDIAVPATNTLHVGYRTDDTDPNESTFTTTMKMQMPSTGNYADTTFYGTVNIPLVLSVGSIIGAATAQFTGSVGNDINIYSVSATSGYFDELTVGTATGNKLYVSKPGIVSVGNDTNATNSSTGAVIVDGGVGIAKDLYVGGTLFPNSLDLSGTLTVAALNATTLQSTNGYFSTIAVGTNNTTKLNVLTTGAVNVQNTNPSVSSTTGAVTVSGGVGIAKDLYVAGTIYPTDISMGTFSAGLIQATSLQATNGYFSTLAVGTNNATKINVTSGGAMDIQNTTPSVTPTSGALTVAGGVGIAGNLYVGGTLVPTDLSMGTITASLFKGSQFEGTNGYFTTVAASTASFTRGTIGSSTPVTISSTGNVAITDTTDSTSTITGALKVSGGASVAKNLYVGGTLVPTDLTLTTANATTFQATNGYFTTVAAATASFTRGTIGSSTPVTISSTGNVAITDTTDSTSNTTGALKVTGGASVQKNLYVGGTLVPGDLALTTINATSVQATNGYFSNLGTVNAAYLSAGTTAGAKLTVDKAGLVQINNNTNVASSTATSGAVSMDGGLYVAKNARVAGTLWVGSLDLPATLNATTFQGTNGYFTTAAASTGDFAYLIAGTATGSKVTINQSGVVNINNNDTITGSADTVGALNVDGGVYIANNLNVAGTLWVGTFSSTTLAATTVSGTNGYFTNVGGGTVTMDKAVFGSSGQFTVTTAGNINSSASGTVTGDWQVGGSIKNAAVGTQTAANNAVWSGTSLTGTLTLNRLTSSQRFKFDIVEADSSVLSAAKQVRAYHFKSAIDFEYGLEQLGFIAERVDETGLTHAVQRNEFDQVEGVNTTALLAALYTWVKDLEDRVTELENSS